MYNDFDVHEAGNPADENPLEGVSELEISDLAPTQRSHHLLLRFVRLRAALARLRYTRARKPAPLSQRRHTLGRALTACGVCAALLVLLIGNIPGLRARFVGFIASTPAPMPTQETRVTFGSMPIIINHFGTVPPNVSQSSPGPLPATCPQISTLQYFTTPLDPPGLGASTVWLSGFTGPSAALDNLMPINAQVAHAPWPGGWYESVAVFIQKGYSGNVTLQGADQKGNARVWLSKNNPQILSTTLTLNLDDGTHYLSNGQWEMTSVIIAVSSAACYTLQASWSNSSWTRYFAAGE